MTNETKERNTQQLVEDNMKLVYFVIHKYCPAYINDEDIVQCGMLGLCKAAENWDESRTLFSSFASRCILYEIYNEFDKRKKFKGTLSLEHPLYPTDSEPTTFADMIVGEEDIDFVDDEAFIKKLKPDERTIVEYRRLGYNNNEIARKMGCSYQAISERIRKLRHVWRMVNEE